MLAKLSVSLFRLGTCLTTSLVFTLAPACSTTTDLPEAPQAPPVPARTMTTVPPMPAAPENLVHDPDFEGALTYTDSPDGFAIFTISLDHATTRVRYEATTPVGAGMAVLYAKAKGNGTVALTAQGGAGPFDASVWVGSADGAVPNPVSLLSYAEGILYDLVVDGPSQVHGQLTWVRYTAHLKAPLPGSSYYLFGIPNGKELAFAAPELLGHAVATTTNLPVATARPAPRTLLAQVEAAERIKTDHRRRAMPAPGAARAQIARAIRPRPEYH